MDHLLKSKVLVEFTLRETSGEKRGGEASLTEKRHKVSVHATSIVTAQNTSKETQRRPTVRVPTRDLKYPYLFWAKDRVPRVPDYHLCPYVSPLPETLTCRILSEVVFLQGHLRNSNSS